MLDAVEPLFLGGRHELPVDDDRRCGISVVGVQAKRSTS